MDEPQLGCILFSSFSPGDSLNQSPGSLFGSPAASFWRPLGFAHPPHDGVALLAALLEEDAPTLLLLRQQIAKVSRPAPRIREVRRLYSPSCRQGVFPETGLSAYEVLGNSERQRARKEGRGSLHALGLGPLRVRRKTGGVSPIFRTVFSSTQCQAVENSI